MKYRSLLLLLPLVLILSACGGAAAGPPEIRYGEDACDQCHMLIGEPRFAAAYITEDGTARRFDDIGEMFIYVAETGEAVREAWVHDFEDESWLEADDATFVHNPVLTTPMGWGLAAFADPDKAEAYRAQHGGVLLSAVEVQDQVEDGDLRPAGISGAHDHDEHDHHSAVRSHLSHSHEEK